MTTKKQTGRQTKTEIKQDGIEGKPKKLQRKFKDVPKTIIFFV